MDEKTSVQALDRTAPVLPLLPGTPSGPPMTTPRHRAVEFKRLTFAWPMTPA